MARVWIVQLLCPERHAIMAAPYEKTNESEASEIAAGIKTEMAKTGVRWECAICKSTHLKFEEGATRFMSLAEAMPHMKKVEVENILSRIILDASAASGGHFSLESPGSS